MINKPLNNDEYIDLFSLFKNIWDGKFKIILITLISLIIGIGYSYTKPALYEISLDLKESKPREFIKFLTINKFVSDLSPFTNKVLNLNQIDESSTFHRFKEEFLDYEELINVLENKKTISKQISNLNRDEKNSLLFKYAKRFKIKTQKIKNQKDKTTIIFIWNDTNEAVEILDEAFKMVLNNLQTAVFNEIDEFLSIKKFIDKNSDLARIDDLIEESEIAKELNIADSSMGMDTFNLSPSSSDVSFNINTASPNYYLRGYKAINKEITLIKNRRYRETENIQKKLNEIRNDNMQLIDYNLYLINVKALKNSSNIWISSLILGLIIGIFYTIISGSIQRYKAAEQR